MNFIMDESPQGSDEWLNARAGVITASAMSKVIAKGRGNQPSKVRQDYMLQLASERLIGRAVTEENFSTYWMQRGNELEPQARAWYGIKKRRTVHEMGLIYLDESRTIGASVDGLVGDSERLLEIKCPKLSTHIGYIMDGVCPAQYVPQVQGQMWVTGLDVCDFMSFHPDSHIPAFIVTVERDDKFIADLQSACATFLEELDELVQQLEELAA